MPISIRKLRPDLTREERLQIANVWRQLRRMGVLLPGRVRKAMREDMRRAMTDLLASR